MQFIIDDLGAIVVIALFYGSKISWLFLAAAAVIYAALLACNYYKLKFGFVQVVLGLVLWYFVLQSGIEAKYFLLFCICSASKATGYCRKIYTLSC